MIGETALEPSTAPWLPGVRLAWGWPAPERRPSAGVPLMVGFVEREHDIAPRPLARWEAFAALVGDSALGYLDYAVRGFFENGGATCWVTGLAERRDATAARLQAHCEEAFRPGGMLDDIDAPDLVCMPDAGWGPLSVDAAAHLAVQRTVLAHCNRMNDRLAILDCLPHPAGRAPGVDSARPHARIAWLNLWHGDDARPTPGGRVGPVVNGAIYWPWIAVAPLPRHRGRATLVPPCGHVAGVYARIDASSGRHRAPANELLEGAFDLDDQAGDEILAQLNDDGVNALRVMPGRGVRVCGARSMSSLPAWRHVSARRVVLGLARWSRLGLGDLVYEPHTAPLWARVRQRVEGWCLARHAEGSLAGDAPDEAYFVKCDAETNPPESREQGRVVCEVGLALTTPAEFIVVQLVQSVAGTALAG